MGGVCSNLVVKGPKPLTHVQRLNGIKARVFLSNLAIRVLVALSPISGIKAAFTKYKSKPGKGAQKHAGKNS